MLKTIGLTLIIFMLILAAEGVAEIKKSITQDPQFWVTLALVVTFILDMIRRTVQRYWDKQDREIEKLEEKIEREEREVVARRERKEIAAAIEEKVILQSKVDAAEREKNTLIVTKKLDDNQFLVEEVKEKVVTLKVADEHKDELKHAIDDATHKIEDNTKVAADAFEVANTINKKLEKMSEAGLLTDEGQKARGEIDQIENAKPPK